MKDERGKMKDESYSLKAESKKNIEKVNPESKPIPEGWTDDPYDSGRPTRYRTAFVETRKLWNPETALKPMPSHTAWIALITDPDSNRPCPDLESRLVTKAKEFHAMHDRKKTAPSFRTNFCNWLQADPLDENYGAAETFGKPKEPPKSERASPEPLDAEPEIAAAWAEIRDSLEAENGYFAAFNLLYKAKAARFDDGNLRVAMPPGMIADLAERDYRRALNKLMAVRGGRIKNVIFEAVA